MEFLFHGKEKEEDEGMTKTKGWLEPIRKPKEIAELLVKICKENDDRIGQALWNALDMQYGEVPDLFVVEDDELLKVLEKYYKNSVKGNRNVRLQNKRKRTRA